MKRNSKVTAIYFKIQSVAQEHEWTSPDHHRNPVRITVRTILVRPVL